MPEVWQTIEQAAVTLGLSVRTVNRHITGGKLQSRLYDGRREVLVSLPESVRPREPMPPPSQPTASVRHAGATVTGPAAADVAPAQEEVPPSVSPNASPPPSQHYDSVRRAMAADYGSEKPLDMQTLLTLADSVDDKASLAVAAYQTLAHSAEVQVQSLRRVALGAWASVGLLAAGAIVAVGWGTYRLTWAEGTAASLRSQVDEQKDRIRTLETETQSRQKDLEHARLEAAKLELELARLPTTDDVADLARFALDRVREDQNRATTRPTSDKPTPPLTPTPRPPAAPGPEQGVTSGVESGASPTTRPATMASTQPAGVAGSGPEVVFKTPTRSPATHPASMPAMTGQRPTYITNSREPFDSR